MKKGLVVSLAVASSLFATVQVGDGKIDAKASSMLIHSTKTPKASALGAGMDGVYTNSISNKTTIGFGGSLALPIWESKDEGVYYGDELLGLENTRGGKSGLFFSLNRLYVEHQADGFGVKGGRFLLDVPMISSDLDHRLAPNAVEALLFNVSLQSNIKLHAGYINAFSGVSNETTNSMGESRKADFVSMSDSLVATTGVESRTSAIDDMGLIVLGASLKDDSFDAQGWLYVMPTIKVGNNKGKLISLYADGAIKMLNPIKTLAFQAYTMKPDSDFKAYEHTVLGAKVELDVTDQIEINGALNIVSGDGLIVEPWGSSPAYARGYEASLEGLHKGYAARVGTVAKVEDFKITGNVITLKSDDKPKDYKATHFEGVVAKNLTKDIEADGRILVNSGDAEGVALIARVAYKF